MSTATRSLPRTIGAHAILLTYTAIALFPVILVIMNSFKSRAGIFRAPLTPHINTVITGIGIAALAAVFPLDILGDLVSMGTLIAFVAVCAGVLILRYTRPDLPRTFRVPWAPVTCTLGVVSCLGLLYWENWYQWLLMGIWTLIGLAIYFGYGYRHSQLRRARAAAESN